MGTRDNVSEYLVWISMLNRSELPLCGPTSKTMCLALEVGHPVPPVFFCVCLINLNNQPVFDLSAVYVR